jgi:hypothetical protein
MKKTSLAISIFSLFLNHAFGQEQMLSGDEYAIQQQRNLEEEMVKSGFLSFLDCKNLKEEKDKISQDIEKVFHEENSIEIERCSKALSGYLNKWDVLEEEFIKYKKNTQPLR